MSALARWVRHPDRGRFSDERIQKIGTGASFTAFGSGSVGLSAVMAARIVGATTIIAVDVVASRLALAKELEDRAYGECC